MEELEERSDIQKHTFESHLSVASSRSCTEYWEIFAKAAKNETDPIYKDKLELLKDVTSYCFNFDDFSPRPFRPLFHFYKEGRSPLIEDLDDKKIELLSVLLEEVNDMELKARVADVLHFCKKNRLQYAQIAVDSYLNCLNKNSYPRYEYLDRVKRLSQLAIKFIKGAAHITERVVDFFNVEIQSELDQKNYYPVIELLHIFAQYDLIEANKKEYYAALCCELVTRLEENEMFKAAEIGYELAIKYFSSTEQQKKLLQTSFAQLCIKISNIETPIQKLHYLRKAIGLYRQAGSVANKVIIESLELQLPDATKRAWVGNMKQYQVNADVTNGIESLENSLLNTSLKDKLVQLTSIDNFLDKNMAISYVQGCLQGGFLKSGIAEIYDSNLNLQHTSINDDTDNFTHEFFILKASRYSMRSAFIQVIRMIIMDEHNPTLLDLKFLFSVSPWIPIANELQISRGVYAGFCGDWMKCGLFLLPIIEVMLGAYLTSKGLSTVKCNIDHTQENRSLSELLSDQEAINILGEQISFELDFLLINPIGYKLRHGGAHGGISDEEFLGDGIKIIWWVIIKLLFELK